MSNGTFYLDLIIECPNCGHPNDYELELKYLVCDDTQKPPDFRCLECNTVNEFNTKYVVCNNTISID